MSSAISFGVFCRRGAFHQRDHAVEEGFAGPRGDAHHQPVGHQPRAAGDGGTVTAGFADHRGALAGDGAFIHRGGAFHHLAIGGDRVARLDQDQLPDLDGLDVAQAVAGTVAGIHQHLGAGGGFGGAECVRRALPRPSATASAKLANSTVNHSHSAICSPIAALGPPARVSRRASTVATRLTSAVEKMTGLRARLRGSSLRKACLTAGPRISARTGRGRRTGLCGGMRLHGRCLG